MNINSTSIAFIALILLVIGSLFAMCANDDIVRPVLRVMCYTMCAIFYALSVFAVLKVLL